MTDYRPTSASVTRRRARVRRIPRKGRRTALLVLTVVLAHLTIVVVPGGDYRYLVAPLMAVVDIAAIFVGILWSRDRHLPLF